MTVYEKRFEITRKQFWSLSAYHGSKNIPIVYVPEVGDILVMLFDDEDKDSTYCLTPCLIQVKDKDIHFNWNVESFLTHISTYGRQLASDIERYNSICEICKHPAYQGLYMKECSNPKCRG